MNNAHFSHTLILLTPSNEHQLMALKRLDEIDQELDILKYSTGVSNSLEVLVPPHKLNFVKEFARRRRLKTNVKANNYGR